MKRLSICIPTYNFGEFIGQTLSSILPQVSAEVEVVILDGGSTDETTAVVNALQKDYPQLIYHYQNFRGGIDKDIEKVVSLAQGDYCWLFSADDIMYPDAIAKVLTAIKSNYDIYLCEHVLCNLQMQPISEYPIFNNINSPTVFNLNDITQKNEYFSSARTSEAFFSFMSTPIFKKNVWDKPYIPESFRSTCWIVAGHLLSLIPLGVKVSYLGEALLYKRGDNDSFATQGIVNRYRIAIEAFQYVSHEIFEKNTKEAFHIRRVLQQDIPLRALIIAKLKASKAPEKEDISVLNRIVKIQYADSGIKNNFKYLLYRMIPVLIIEIVYSIKKFTVRCLN